MNILGSIFGARNQASPSIDSTLYRIETSPHEYIGTIIYQDDTVIKFKKKVGERLVKILKSNIKRISIISESN